MPTNFDCYERIAPLYDWVDLPFEYACYRRIRPLLFRQLSGRLLDAGVGTGRNFPFYPRGSDVVGIDLSPAMLARARQRIDVCAAASIELKAMDVTALDLPDCSFDAAIASFLFCVLPDESQVPALRELGRVVKPGSVIRLLNYVRPQGAVGRALARLWQPLVAWAFAASFDRQPEAFLRQASLELLQSSYVVPDLIKLIAVRNAKD